LGETPERQAKMSARWTYGVLVAALLHDIGKPLSDLKIQLYSADTPLGPWTGMAGPMSSSQSKHPNSISYAFSFNDDRSYGAHQKLAVMLLQQFVPLSTLNWLSQDEKLMLELTQYLAGEEVTKTDPKNGEISRLIKAADGKSVRLNLLQGPRTRFAVARTVPLIERILTGLNAMLMSGDISLNRPSASGFVDPDGQHIWLLVPRVANDLREFLEKNETRMDQKSGLPTDNRRLYDTLAEYGKCIPTPSGRSIWRFHLKSAEWNPQQSFSALKFQMSSLYKNQENRPSVFLGEIQVVQNDDALSDENDAMALVAEHVQTTPPSNSELPSERPSRQEAEPLGADVTEANASSAWYDTNDGPGKKLTSQRAPDFLPSDVTATGTTNTGDALQTPASNIPVSTGRSIQPKLSSDIVDIKADSPLVQLFLSWLQNGVISKNLSINESSALVHFVPEGMLLATPGVFQRFAQENPAELSQLLAESQGVKDQWRKVQMAFQKSGYVAKAPPMPGAQNGYLHSYTTAKMGARALSVFLMPRPQALFSPVPEINPMIISQQAKAEVKT
jgi:hypothetical protein